MNENTLILPGVRRAVSLLAAACRYTLITGAALSIAELLLLLLAGFLVPGLVCGFLSRLSVPIAVALLGLVIPWCHTVLLAERGWVLTRYLSLCTAVFALLYPLSDLWLFITGSPLIANHGLLPVVCCALWLVFSLLNLGHMAAARWHLQLRIVLIPILILIIIITDLPELLIICSVFKLLLLLAAGGPLRMLADAAPRIISLPDLPTPEQN